MNACKATLLIAGMTVAAIMLAPILGCDTPRRHFQSSRYDSDRDHALAADQWHTQHEEERREDHEQSRDHTNY
jgi:hypothetical protein